VPTRRAVALRALSADADLLGTLRAGRARGRVHSVFERVVNIEDDRGELFALASRDVDNAPSTVVVDVPGFREIGIDRGDPAVAAAGELRVGPVVVALDGVAGWEGALPAYPRDDVALRANLRNVGARLERHAQVGGLFGYRRGDSAFDVEAAAVLARRAGQLLDALSRGDREGARAHAAAMIGLGCGLTPSGDDFLVGLFAILNVAGSPCHALRGVCPDVLADARHSTNPISLAALTHAARGRVRESIVALTRELIGGSRDGVVVALDRVLAIGSTSGSEIAAGMIAGFELNLQVGGTPSCR
jgi:hypothetical protein